jgi:hypothetical protein
MENLVVMSPQEYATAFLERQKFPMDKKLAGNSESCYDPMIGLTWIGVRGRFTRGLTDADFEKLSDEPGAIFSSCESLYCSSLGKLLSWVCTEELLQPLLGMNSTQALLAVGFGTGWIESRLLDGTIFKVCLFFLCFLSVLFRSVFLLTPKLVLFPSRDGTIATWDGLFEIVQSVYTPVFGAGDILHCLLFIRIFFIL